MPVRKCKDAAEKLLDVYPFLRTSSVDANGHPNATVSKNTGMWVEGGGHSLVGSSADIHQLEEKLDIVAGFVVSLGQLLHQSLDRETQTADIPRRKPSKFQFSRRCDVLRSSWEPLDGN